MKGERTNKRPLPPAAVYSVRESAAILRVSTKTVHRLIQRGEIPAKKVGGAYRVPVRALDAFLA